MDIFRAFLWLLKLIVAIFAVIWGLSTFLSI
jgi:hypothetical protein